MTASFARAKVFKIAGVAQVDAFELLFTSEDDPEGGYGAEVTPSDFRYIGYRVFQPEGQAGTCDYLLEFSFTTWVREELLRAINTSGLVSQPSRTSFSTTQEKQKRLNLEFFQVRLRQ